MWWQSGVVGRHPLTPELNKQRRFGINRRNSLEWVTDRSWSNWVIPALMTGHESYKTRALHCYRALNPSSDTAKGPQSWATFEFFISALHYLQIVDAPLSMQLKADHHSGGQWSNHPRPHGRALAGRRPALRDRLAFHPTRLTSLPKACRRPRPLTATDQCSRHSGFWPTRRAVTPAVGDADTVCASVCLCVHLYGMVEKKSFLTLQKFFQPNWNFQKQKSKRERLVFYNRREMLNEPFWYCNSSLTPTTEPLVIQILAGTQG